SRLKYKLDMLFRHNNAQYLGVIIRNAYLQKKMRLVKNYLLDLDASVQAVVSLDIEYSKGSRKATLLIWRPQFIDTASRYKLLAVEEAAVETLRDNEGNAVNYPGLRLCLSDFTYEELAQKEIGNNNVEIYISRIQLRRYLATMKSKEQRALDKHSFPKDVKKRKGSKTPE
ncbi:hypothetical protein K505DRAFT_229207, partial [Melanomma pulvis-pyrius CBS 109.77]